MTAIHNRDPGVPPDTTDNGQAPTMPESASAAGPRFSGQHGKAAADGGLRSTQADIDAAGRTGRRSAARIASLRVPATAVRDVLLDSRRLLELAVGNAARTPVRYSTLSATAILGLTAFFFAGDTITLHLAFSLANNASLEAWLMPVAASTLIVLGTRYLIRGLLDSVPAPSARTDRPQSGPSSPRDTGAAQASDEPATDVDTTAVSGPDIDEEVLARRERILDSREEAVRPVRFRIFLILIGIAVVGLLGVAIGFSVLGGPVLGGDLPDGGLTAAGGAFIAGMLLFNTAGSGAVAAYSWVCGATEYAQARRGFRVQAGQHHRLALFGGLLALRRYEAGRAELEVRLLRVDARKKAGKLEGHRRLFGAGDAAGIPPLVATLVSNLEVAKDKASDRSFHDLVPPSLFREDRQDGSGHDQGRTA